MTRDEIASVVAALSDLLPVLREAEPADRAEIYLGLGLRLVYQPEDRTVRAQARLRADSHWLFDGVRGAS